MMVEELFFFIVVDEMNGCIIYGGGCYMYFELFDVDGSFWVDFNWFYNLFCVFIGWVMCLLLLW